jgi:hypothetical protein
LIGSIRRIQSREKPDIDDLVKGSLAGLVPDADQFTVGGEVLDPMVPSVANSEAGNQVPTDPDAAE